MDLQSTVGTVPKAIVTVFLLSKNEKIDTLKHEISQDEGDQLRQEYVDMEKKNIPKREELTDQGDTTHFFVSEFNASQKVDGEKYKHILCKVLDKLELVRSRAGNVSMTINSGFRNPYKHHNILKAKTKESVHLYGQAADISLDDFNQDGKIDGKDRSLITKSAKALGTCIEPAEKTCNCFSYWAFDGFLCNCRESESNALGKQAQEKIASSDWQTRKQGIDLLIKLKEGAKSFNKKTDVILLKMLHDEVQRKIVFKERDKAEGKSIGQIGDEFDKEYPKQSYGDYVVSLANLLAEEKITGGLPILFRFLVNTDYVVSPVLPIYYGNTAFEYLIKKVSTNSLEERKQAIQILSLWAHPPEEAEDWDPSIISKLSERQRQRALPLLLNALKDPDSYTVYCATSALEAYLNNPEVKENLIELSHAPYDDVRNKARRILKEIAK